MAEICSIDLWGPVKHPFVFELRPRLVEIGKAAGIKKARTKKKEGKNKKEKNSSTKSLREDILGTMT